MDPDATLQIMLDRARVIIEAIDGAGDDVDAALVGAAILDEANELAEAVQNLDTWIRKGGAVPSAWKRSKGRK